MYASITNGLVTVGAVVVVGIVAAIAYKIGHSIGFRKGVTTPKETSTYYKPE